jgi:hypothetical protein
MSTVSIPTASMIQSQKEETPFEFTMSLIKTLDASDLAKLMKAVIVEIEKRVKNTKPMKAAKKAGSMPKGVVPPQLKKPRAWVDFTLKHAQENGWESFTVHQTKKDKVTGEKIEEEIEMPASIELDGRHIFPDSVDEKNPQGKTLIHKDAMSLSKQRWAPKTSEGSHEELYEEFLAQYEEDEESDQSSDSESEKTVVRVKAADKAAEKAKKDEEKEEKKRLKEEEKEEKKRLKEEEKAAKLAEKEAEKAAKLAAKEKKPVVEKKAVATPAKPAKAAAAPAAPLKAKAAKAATEWSCPADGALHRWTFNGEAMLRNSDNEVWKAGKSGKLGEWMGIFDPKTGTFDDSVEEPHFDDDEE